MSQLPFCSMFDSAEEATNAAIVRSGKEFKEVAGKVFPSLAVASAYARLKASLRCRRRSSLPFRPLVLTCRTRCSPPLLAGCTLLIPTLPDVALSANAVLVAVHAADRPDVRARARRRLLNLR